MKKKVYESPVTTCRQVLMEADVMQAASIVETRGKVSAGYSQDGGNAFTETGFESTTDITGW